MPILQGIILAQFVGYFKNIRGTNKDFDMTLLRFEKVIHDTAIRHLKIPEELVGKFIQEQVQEIHKLFGHVQAIGESFQLWGQTPNYFCKRDIAKQACGFPGQLIANFLLSGKQIPEFSPEDEQLVKDLVAVMENEDSVHDFLDTKPYVDHWGGMSDQDFIDLARRIVIDLNAMHKHADEDNKFMALTRRERIEDLLDLLKKCKGTLYAMWKMSLYEECLKDPRGMQIRFVDNQKNNWQKKAEGRKRKLRDAEIEEQEEVTGVRNKKRRPAKSKPEVPLEELGMEYFDDPRGVPLAPPEKPLARKGVNVGRTGGSPKRIFRGPKCRAIEAIRKADSQREGTQSATRAVGSGVPVPARLETQLAPLAVMPAQDSAVGEAPTVLALRGLQSAQEAISSSVEIENAEGLGEQAQEAGHEPGLSEAALAPKVEAGSHEYFAAGMNNMEAANAQYFDANYSDLLWDTEFVAQDHAPRNPDDLFGTNNSNGQTLPVVATPNSNNSQVRDMDFLGPGPGTAYGYGASHPFNNNSTPMRAAPGPQMPRNNFSSIHGVTATRIANPTFQGHQGFNFNGQFSGTTDPQFSQAGQFPTGHDGNALQYINPSWLQNAGESSSSATNTTTSSSSSAGAASNIFLNSTLYAGENAGGAGIEYMTGSEWLDQFAGDIFGGTNQFPF